MQKKKYIYIYRSHFSDASFVPIYNTLNRSRTLYPLNKLPENNQNRNIIRKVSNYLCQFFVFGDIELTCNQPSFSLLSSTPQAFVPNSMHFDVTKKLNLSALLVIKEKPIFSIFSALQVENDKIIKSWRLLEKMNSLDGIVNITISSVMI